VPRLYPVLQGVTEEPENHPTARYKGEDHNKGKHQLGIDIFVLDANNELQLTMEIR